MSNKQTPANFHYLFPELTLKQYSALEMFSYGSQPKQVASQMSISQETVKQHMTAVKNKLDCRTTTDLRYVFITRIMSTIAMKSSNNQVVNIIQT